MDLAFTAKDEQFRAEVREFLRAHLPVDLARREAQGFHLSRDDLVDWHRIVYEKGWIAPNWPREFGGTGWTPIQKHLYELECGLANAPETSLIGLSMAGPVICRFGSPELQQRFLEPILSGDLWFCQGFSEPMAGSDLASLRTRATAKGDRYVISGQKTWTTSAHFADYMICLCRTNADVAPQAGLSMLLVPMDAAGMTVRPIKTIDGEHTVNEVFLDDVVVPGTNLVGQENTGWAQAKFLLGNERTHNAFVGMLRRYLERIPRLVAAERNKGLAQTAAADLLRKHALLQVDVDALEWSVLRVLASTEGPALAAAASALKVRGSEYLVRAAELEMEILGPQITARYTAHDALPLHAEASSFAPGRTSQYFYWHASTIFGGANEIQRNIIWNTLCRA